MKSLVAAALLAAIAAAPAGAQDDEWVELRFHRVFLLNGNFIDGKLIKDTAQGTTLLLKVGEITVRRDMIDRVEFIQMRTRNDRPKVIAPPKGTPAATPRRTEEKPPPAVDTPLPMTAGEIDKETRTQVDDLLARLRKSPPEARGEVVNEISALGVKAALYLALNLDALDDSVLTYVGPMLGRFKSPKVLEILAKMTLNSKAAVRSQAAAALGVSDDPTMSKFLLPLLQDPDTIIRGIAVEALGRLGAADAIPAVTRACLDPDRAMRGKAFFALQALLTKAGRSGELRSLLFDLVRDAKGPARAEVLQQLARDSKKEDWASFSPYADDPEPAVRQMVALTLGNLAAPDSAGVILARVGSEKDKWSRMYLAQAALKLRAYRAIDDMIQWLGEDDPDVKAAAHQALRGLTSQTLDARRDLWQNYWNSARSQFLK